MTNSINELEYEAEVIFLIGTNTTENHPVIGYKMFAKAWGVNLL